MSMTFNTSWSRSVPGSFTSELCFPRHREIFFPRCQSHRQAAKRGIVKCCLGSKKPAEPWARLWQKIIRAGLNQCREIGDTRLEANHEGKGKGRGEDGARTISTHTFLLKREEKGDRKIKSRMEKMGRVAFTCSGQEFIHSFTQAAFIKHRLCVSRHAGCWKYVKQ